MRARRQAWAEVSALIRTYLTEYPRLFERDVATEMKRLGVALGVAAQVEDVEPPPDFVSGNGKARFPVSGPGFNWNCYACKVGG